MSHKKINLNAHIDDDAKLALNGKLDYPFEVDSYSEYSHYHSEYSTKISITFPVVTEESVIFSTISYALRLLSEYSITREFSHPGNEEELSKDRKSIIISFEVSRDDDFEEAKNKQKYLGNAKFYRDKIIKEIHQYLAQYKYFTKDGRCKDAAFEIAKMNLPKLTGKTVNPVDVYLWPVNRQATIGITYKDNREDRATAESDEAVILDWIGSVGLSSTKVFFSLSNSSGVTIHFEIKATSDYQNC